MNCFHVSNILIAQGANKNHLASVLESLHQEKLLPAWGPGETGVDLSPREVVSLVLGSAAPIPEQAAAFVREVATLPREEDGNSFAHFLTATFDRQPHNIGLQEIVIDASGKAALVRYRKGTTDTFTCDDGNLQAFRTACVIRGSLLAAIAARLHFETETGWVPEK